MKKYFLLLFALFVNIFIISAQNKTELQFDDFISDCSNLEWPYPDSSVTIKIMQPLDHNNPDGPKYPQYIHIKHKDFSKPVVLHDRGYYARPNRTHELTKILQCNQVEIEHRFFSPSAPEEPIDWSKLDIEQAAEDQHRIAIALKKIYGGKWINTGGSKGGQAALFHEYFFPDDNDVTVAYVAPINRDMEDKRIPEYLADSISTKENRLRMLTYQRELLKRRDEIIPMLRREIEDNKYELVADINTCFEHSVFEMSFGWWQYKGEDIEEIPLPGATAEELYKPFKGNIGFFTKGAKKRVAPFNYQAYTEIGFYDYDTRPFKDLLIAVKNDFASNKPYFYDPYWSDPFDAAQIREVHDWLTNEAKEVIYIYGENDPWTATGIWPSGKTNSFRMTLKDGNHGASILKFKGEEREKILKALEKWLDLKIDREFIETL
ncbi:MAG: peptidase [Bacteroidetes bacterium]|nr:peptidase [Bacteroidota bacterium]